LSNGSAIADDYIVIADLVKPKSTGTDFNDKQSDPDFALDAVFVAPQDATVFGGARVEQLIAPWGIQSG
jgi:hypothetical protein